MMAKLAIKKIQYGIDREAAKILVLSTDKIDLCENLTSKKILSSHQSRKTGQARFLYSPLAKAFEKEKKKLKSKGKANKSNWRVWKTTGWF